MACSTRLRWLADLFGGMDAVIEVGDEAGDGALEVDVVLPEGVVGVDEQGLIGRAAAEGLVLELLGGLIWGSSHADYKVVPGGTCYEGAAGMPRLGDIWPWSGCDRLEAMS